MIVVTPSQSPRATGKAAWIALYVPLCDRRKESDGMRRGGVGRVYISLFPDSWLIHHVGQEEPCRFLFYIANMKFTNALSVLALLSPLAEAGERKRQPWVKSNKLQKKITEKG